MEEFWKSALTYCGSAAIAGVLGYVIYPQIISSPYLKNLTHNELFALMSLLIVVTFAICAMLINATTKRRAGGNTVVIKSSTIHGSVRAGDNGTDKSK
ncbi:hypothetical protein [Pseudomonas umsongensis]|uniref:hypothetical protein n=1 Tax=Pseudomonas umsongensis TaxID=198618 RepID=UPI0015C0DF70|nr:hypothetical protein [Pseudomonas umsongensis]NWL22157.1 hypothetical protein [Pseudomonas umsongensis]